MGVSEVIMPLKIIREDITKMRVDAIVNTTNGEMTGCGGIDEAVHRAAGPLLDAECERIRPLRLGEAKVTRGYSLDCKYIIHTAGPVWRGGDCGEAELLESCYKSSLAAAVRLGCETVAFPLICSGVYLFPKDRVLKLAVSVISEFLFEHELTVYLCVFDKKSYEFSRKLFDDISEFIDDKYAESHGDGFSDELKMLDRANLPQAPTPSAFPMPERCKPSTPKFSFGRTAKEPKAEGKAARRKLGESKPFPDIFAEAAAPADTEKSEDERLGSAKNITLKEYLKSMDKPFAYKLFDLIDERGMTDVECYKKANVDKKTFSKIKCNPMTYKPSKQTAVAFAIALRLDFDETQELLASAGLTLSRSFTFDKIIRYFIKQGNYNVFEINEALFEFDQVLLGC